MSKLQVFMDNGFNAFTVDSDTSSDNPDYEFLMSYFVEGELYKIYYNSENEEGLVLGVMVVGDTTYDLVIEDNLEEEDDETKRNLVIEATLGENTITITYTQKTEGNEEKEEIRVEKDIDGVESEIVIEIKQEDETFKVSIEDGVNSYQFRVSEDEEGKHYKLDYTVDGVKGMAIIKETVDEEGNTL